MADDLVSVRYLVDDVDASLLFYTTHLGFTELTSFLLRSLMSCAATCVCCSVVPPVPQDGQCPMVDSRRRVAGTGFT